MTAVFDVVYVADVRFEGGTSTALAVEIVAAARAGLRTGLLAIKGSLLGLPFPMHPDLRRLIDEGLTERLDPDMPVHALMVQIHHPTIIERRPHCRIHTTCDRLVVVLHHPMVDAAGRRQYDLDKVVRNAREAFGSDVVLAPVSPVVRWSLPASLPPRTSLFDEDWPNLIEADAWPVRARPAPRWPVTIGRHARPDPLKWPSREDAWRAYPPDGARYRVRVLGAGDFLTEKYGGTPANWELLPFAWDGVAAFLGSLDFYVYYHDPDWSEAFGRTILEALAVGLVVILPPHFEPLFGKAALYCVPTHVDRLITRYVEDPELYAEQCAIARRFVETVHDARLYEPRMRRLIAATEAEGGESRPPAAAGTMMPPLPVRNVLFMSSNGIGVGHITQQLAIAERLERDLTPVFCTMSYAMRAAVDASFQSHFLPHHAAIDAPVDSWNTALAEEVFALLTHLRPRVFAYDATAVFSGVVDALAMLPDIFKIWVRRPFWRECHRPFLACAWAFDAVIEPGELAEEFDHGPTAEQRHLTLRVPPVLHVDPARRLPRAAARQALGLDQESVVVAVQLGSGANFDMSAVRDRIVRALLRHPNVIVVETVSPITPEAKAFVPLSERHRQASLFPSFRYSLAFDAAVSAAGYNAFHEQVLGAIPTLFVPNEAPDMDLQAARAHWADVTGRGWMARRDVDMACIEDRVEALIDARERAAVRMRCADIEWTNGAEIIARYVEDHARLVRTDLDPRRFSRG